LVIVDASPLIIFARSELMTILDAILGPILVPEAAWEECVADPERPAAAALRTALDQGRITVKSAPAWYGPVPVALGSGELAVISLAKASNALALIDDRLARRVARKEGVALTGSAAVLLTAKARGHVPAVKPILEAWAHYGYFLSDTLRYDVLKRAGEAQGRNL
jgi:predicted nucleic acid-binding protein